MRITTIGRACENGIAASVSRRIPPICPCR
jgi:hypothetical protein